MDKTETTLCGWCGEPLRGDIRKYRNYNGELICDICEQHRIMDQYIVGHVLQKGAKKHGRSK